MLINGSLFASITCGLVNPLEAIQKYYLPLWKNEYCPPRNEYFCNTIEFVGSCKNLCIFISDFSYPLQLPIYVHGAIAFNIYSIEGHNSIIIHQFMLTIGLSQILKRFQAW